LYRSRPDGVGLVFGGYPGVTIRRDGEADPIGKTDVLIAMSDGRLGVGECKSKALGLVDEEIEKLGNLADALGASWTFTATLDPSAACGSVPAWMAQNLRCHRRPRPCVQRRASQEFHSGRKAVGRVSNDD
jgi:hypothetical protein